MKYSLSFKNLKSLRKNLPLPNYTGILQAITQNSGGAIPTQIFMFECVYYGTKQEKLLVYMHLLN